MAERPKRCPRGHRHSTQWRPSHGCGQCVAEDRAAEIARRAQTEREEWAKANPAPAALRMIVVDSGRVITHAIPRHLAAQARAMRKRRGPRRRLTV